MNVKRHKNFYMVRSIRSTFMVLHYNWFWVTWDSLRESWGALDFGDGGWKRMRRCIIIMSLLYNISLLPYVSLIVFLRRLRIATALSSSVWITCVVRNTGTSKYAPVKPRSSLPLSFSTLQPSEPISCLTSRTLLIFFSATLFPLLSYLHLQNSFLSSQFQSLFKWRTSSLFHL